MFYPIPVINKNPFPLCRYTVDRMDGGKRGKMQNSTAVGRLGAESVFTHLFLSGAYCVLGLAGRFSGRYREGHSLLSPRSYILAGGGQQ